MPRPLTSRRTVAAAAALVLASVPLAGCAIGTDAATTTQRASGNGANVDAGDLQVRGVTLVKGPLGKASTLVLTVVNRGDQRDALVGASVTQPAATGVLLGTGVTGGSVPLLAYSRTQIGYKSDLHVDFVGVDVAPTRFVHVDLKFERAGTVPLDVMSVEPTGIYEGITPLPQTTATTPPVAVVPAS